MRGQCPGLNGFWGRRCLVIDMRIKCQSCDLTSLLPLTPPETGRQLGYYISNSICVNFNAFIQKEGKGERCTSFPHVFCASLNEQCGPSGLFWPCEIGHMRDLQHLPGFWSLFLQGHISEFFSFKGLTLQEPVMVDKVSKTVSYFSGACNQCSNLR